MLDFVSVAAIIFSFVVPSQNLDGIAPNFEAVVGQSQPKTTSCETVPSDADLTYYSDDTFTVQTGWEYVDCCNFYSTGGDISTNYRFFLRVSCSNPSLGQQHCQRRTETGWENIACPCAEPPC